MLEIKNKINLKPYFTMAVAGTAEYFAVINNTDEIMEAVEFVKEHNLKIFPIGSGSNTVITDDNNSDFLKSHLFLLIKNKGITKIHEDQNLINLKVAAGEDWDQLVEYTINTNLKGLENLSHIPGTVGACPIQNIGAYGSEVSDKIIKVEIIDLNNLKTYEINNNDCEFSYRSSLFKKNLGQFIITNVYFSLEKTTGEIPVPSYKDVQLYFLSKNKKNATIGEIRQAIIEIRNNKIPNPETTPNSGSFFQNPIVDIKIAQQVLISYPEAPYFKIDEEKIKLFAGWLIEKSMESRKVSKNLELAKNNFLVLTNPTSQGDFNELKESVSKIKESVLNKFKIELEVEPNIFI